MIIFGMYFITHKIYQTVTDLDIVKLQDITRDNQVCLSYKNSYNFENS